MGRTKILLVVLGVVFLIGGLGLLRYTRQQRRDAAEGADAGRPQLGVGFLPVT
jgi:hypothetical protein